MPGSSPSSIPSSPISQNPSLIGYFVKDADIFASLFPAEESVDETMAQLIAAMDKLTDAQHDLIYEHFGARKTLEEIRQAEIAATGKEITQQAVSNRLKKIITRLCKELDTPVSRKRTPKNED